MKKVLGKWKLGINNILYTMYKGHIYTSIYLKKARL